MKPQILEIACFSAQSAQIAMQAGADRIELCEDYASGGVTPPEDTIRNVLNHTHIPVFVMIRPRAGDFVYTAADVETMRQQIRFAKQAGCAGFVFGALTMEQTIDLNVCRMLLKEAHPLPCTFHRAFDEIENSSEALEIIITTGFSRILTSGKKSTAMEGAACLHELISQARNRIIIMPGGGVRASNIIALRQICQAPEFHSAALDPQTGETNPDEVKALKQCLMT